MGRRRGGQANPPCSRTTHVTSGAWRAGGLTCSRVAHTGLIVPGLGGWSAGDPLLFRMQRVMTRAVEVTPAAHLPFVWKEFLSSQGRWTQDCFPSSLLTHCSLL